MNTLRLTLGLLVFFCFCNDVARADSDIVQNPVNGHWYQRIDTQRSWAEAKTYCENLDGYLATITSAEENDFIYFDIDIIDYETWLGGYQIIDQGDPSGNWAWVTGEDWSYTNWDEYEPNNFNGSLEDYLQIRTTGYWNDHVNNAPSQSFICEWEECYPGAEWKNHGMYVRCVAQEVEKLISEGVITAEEGDARVTAAAQSDVGKE